MAVRRTSLSLVWSAFYHDPSALSESDRGALKNLFEETGGREWTNSDGWLTDVLLRQWKGVETMNRGRVVGLSLGGNNLQGESNGVAFQTYRGN